jgi:ABC-type proline/glycine betaine transport system substrate-binding protein
MVNYVWLNVRQQAFATLRACPRHLEQYNIHTTHARSFCVHHLPQAYSGWVIIEYLSFATMVDVINSMHQLIIYEENILNSCNGRMIGCNESL